MLGGSLHFLHGLRSTHRVLDQHALAGAWDGDGRGARTRVSPLRSRFCRSSASTACCATKEMRCRWIGQGCIISLVPQRRVKVWARQRVAQPKR